MHKTPGETLNEIKVIIMALESQKHWGKIYELQNEISCKGNFQRKVSVVKIFIFTWFSPITVFSS